MAITPDELVARLSSVENVLRNILEEVTALKLGCAPFLQPTPRGDRALSVPSGAQVSGRSQPTALPLLTGDGCSHPPRPPLGQEQPIESGPSRATLAVPESLPERSVDGLERVSAATTKVLQVADAETSSSLPPTVQLDFHDEEDASPGQPTPLPDSAGAVAEAQVHNEATSPGKGMSGTVVPGFLQEGEDGEQEEAGPSPRSTASASGLEEAGAWNDVLPTHLTLP